MFITLFTQLEKRPITSFFVVLVALFGVIAISNALRAPKSAEPLPEQTVKNSRLFVAGRDESRMTVSAQVKKSDTVDIVALVPGIVQSVSVRPGQAVTPGQTVATITTDYASGAAALSQQRTALETNLTERTYKIEKDIIDLEKRIARADDTKTDREEKAALNRLKIERERLQLDRETARLDLALAMRSDAALHPKALVRGTIEHVAVRPGELVSAGTVLMTLHTTIGSSTLEAAFPKKIGDALLEAGVATLELNGEFYTLVQGYRAKSETATGLVMVTYPLPEPVTDILAQHEYVTLSVPLVPRSETGYLIPIDAIRLAAEETSVVVMDTDHLTRAQDVTLGETIGTSVVVKTGLTDGDMIVLNAAVIPGETIEPIR